MHILSKTTYIRGLQCFKSLHLNKYHPELIDPLTKSQEKKFEIGHSAGALARSLFPGGINCGLEITKNVMESLEKTQKI